MTSGVYFSSVGYGWHLCATFSLFSRHWNGFFRLFSHCYLHPSSSSVSCKFLSGGSAACAFIQPSSCFCLFSFVSPLHVGEQSVVPSVGCTIEQTTHELNRPSVVGSKRRTNQSATRGIFCQLSFLNLILTPTSVHHLVWLLGSCALVHSCAPPTAF
jgi:hypothetical protein